MKLGIRGQLIAAFSLALLVPCLGGAINIFQARHIAESSARVSGDLFPVLALTNKLVILAGDMRDAFRIAIQEEDEDELEIALEIVGKMSRSFSEALDIHQSPQLEELARSAAEYTRKSESLARKVVDGRDIMELMDEAAPLGAAYIQLSTDLREYRKTVTEEFSLAISDVSETSATSQTISSSALLAAVLLGSLISLMVSQRMTNRIKQIVTALRDIAEGDADLTARLEAKGGDELGELATWFNRFVETIHGIISEVALVAQRISSGENSTQVLTSVSSHLSAASTQINDEVGTLTQASGDLATQISSVANSVEESSTNIRTVASATEQMSQNLISVTSNVSEMTSAVDSVSTSMQQMGASMSEIAASSSSAAEASKRATAVARETDKTVDALGTAVDEISEVVGVIDRIAGQTNLLALNATIEAAAAGSIGRGFAVVASEVKELAKQTVMATEDIRQKIEGIQANTAQSIEAIREIVSSIDNASSVATSVASDVQQQRSVASAAAGEMSSAAESVRVIHQNVQEASLGAEEVARNAEELALGANEVASVVAVSADSTNALSQSISTVAAVASETAAGAEKVDEVAVHMADLSAQLIQAVSRFRL